MPLLCYFVHFSGDEFTLYKCVRLIGLSRLLLQVFWEVSMKVRLDCESDQTYGSEFNPDPYPSTKGTSNQLNLAQMATHLAKKKETQQI